MTTRDKAISVLNALTHVCVDAEEGFRSAAAETIELELADLFYDYSMQRARMAGELRAEVRRLGGEPAVGGTVGAAVHRGWMAVKATLVGKDDDSILADCIHGEEVALAAYRDALATPLPFDDAEIVHRHFDLIVAAHERLKSLEVSHARS